MDKVVIDTSVLIKWFSPEEDSDKADLLLALVKAGKTKLILPEGVQLEVLNSLRLTKKFSLDKIQQSIKFFFDLEPELISIDKYFAPGVTDIAFEWNLSSYDAAFLYIAQRRNISMFTADYKHHKKSISKSIVWLKEWKGRL